MEEKMNTKLEKNNQPYEVWVGCYGGTRGTTIGSLVGALLTQAGYTENDVKIHCGGFQKFMDQKVDHPIKRENLEALAKTAELVTDGKVKAATLDTVKFLENHGRKVADAETLRRCDAVYGVDDYITSEYAKLAGQTSDKKYQTVLAATGIKHPVYGVDLDDTEASIDFTKKVIVPKKQGKPITGTGKPKDYAYFDLNGQEYRAGDRAALEAATRDMVYVAQNLAYTIANKIEERRAA
jgi:hypothetical protein